MDKQKKLGKYTPVSNYYRNINNNNFDSNFLFLTNNVAENINSLLNNSFKKVFLLLLNGEKLFLI